MKKKPFFALLTALFCALFAACSSDSGDAGGSSFIAPEGSVDATPALASVATIVDEELHVEFVDLLDRLVGSVRTARDFHPASGSTQAFIAYAGLTIEASRFDALGVGPYADLRMGELLHAPLDEAGLTQAIANAPDSIDEAWIASQPMAYRGFAAFEHLWQSALSESDAEAKRQLFSMQVALASHWRSLGREMRNAWRSPDALARERFVQAGAAGNDAYPSQSETLLRMLESVTGALELLHSDMGMWYAAEPSEVAANAPSAWLDQRVRSAYEALLIAMLGEIAGRVEGGVVQVLEAIDPALASDFLTLLANARPAIEGILADGTTLETLLTIESNRPSFLSAMNEIGSLASNLRTAVIPALESAALFPLGG